MPSRGYSHVQRYNFVVKGLFPLSFRSNADPIILLTWNGGIACILRIVADLFHSLGISNVLIWHQLIKVV